MKLAWVSRNAIRSISSEIHKDLDKYLSRYDEHKYPPEAVAAFRQTFRNANVAAKEIRGALTWKYGRYRVGRTTSKHKKGIEAFVKAWPKYVDADAPTGQTGFAWWRKYSPRVPFISYSFLLHLRSPERVPIIDQHNYRAVRYYLKESGTAVTEVLDVDSPRSWEHVALVRDFVAQVRGVWPARAIPSAEALDRFLMMRGKALKPQRTRSKVAKRKGLYRRAEAKFEKAMAKLSKEDRKWGDAPDVAYTEKEEFEIMREMAMKPGQVANKEEAERYRNWLATQRRKR